MLPRRRRSREAGRARARGRRGTGRRAARAPATACGVVRQRARHGRVAGVSRGCRWVRVAGASRRRRGTPAGAVCVAVSTNASGRGARGRISLGCVSRFGRLGAPPTNMREFRCRIAARAPFLASAAALALSMGCGSVVANVLESRDAGQSSGDGATKTSASSSSGKKDAGVDARKEAGSGSASRADAGSGSGTGGHDGGCSPGTTMCVSDTQMEICGTSGQWGTSTTCAQACVGTVGTVGGSCGGVCVPGTTECASDTQVVTCGSGGQWGAVTTCPAGCLGTVGAIGGSCGGVCVPGANQCSELAWRRAGRAASGGAPWRAGAPVRPADASSRWPRGKTTPAPSPSTLRASTGRTTLRAP